MKLILSFALFCIAFCLNSNAQADFYSLQEGVQMQEADVRDFCRNKISRYKIPKYIFFVNEFPMTGSGKIQKFRLKDLGLQLCKEQGIEII